MTHYHPCNDRRCAWCGMTTADLLAELGGGEERTEFEVRWHSTSDDLPAYLNHRFASHQRAAEFGRQQIGRHGIVRWTVWQRLHRIYADGSSWTGSWQRSDDQEGVAA